MKINETQINEILKMTSNPIIRKMLHKLTKDSGMLYTEMREVMGFKDPRKKAFAEPVKKTKGDYSSVIAYYIKHLKINHIITKDEKTGYYFLTRVGVQCLELIENFEKTCIEYDIDDLDADGKIKVKVSVVGRK